MTYRRFRLSLAQLFVLLVAVTMTAAPSFAISYFLVAKEVDKTMPDGTIVPMWGFALDPDGNANGKGDCFEIPSQAARAASPTCTGLVATVPGPRLNLGTQSVLRINLTNLLPEPVSIVIPGQEMPWSNAGDPFNLGPTWTDGSVGPRTDAAQRVRSFGREAEPNGGRRLYYWVSSNGNPFRVGTYTYHSGTHPQVQVQMGLYGAVSRLTSGGEAYPGIPFDKEVDLLFSEIDPALHQAVDDGTYGTTGPTSTLEYKPRYFLINGQPFDPASPACLDGGLSAMVNDRILFRMINAGLRELAPMMLDSHWQVVGEGGRWYKFPREQYSVLLPAGGTRDVLWTPAAAGTFWILDRTLNLTNAVATDGGFQACIEVAAGP